MSRIFQDSVDESLRGIFGDKTAEAIYNHLRENYGLAAPDLFARPREFSAVINLTFGAVGQTVEKAIAKRLYWKLGLIFDERQNYRLEDYVDDAILEKATRHAQLKPMGEDDMRKATEFVKDMKPTEHAILFYSEPEMKRRLLFAFLKRGLDEGEAAAYIASQETADQIREAMRNAGFNVEELEKTGALHIISYKEWYYLDGYTDSKRTNALWQQLYDETKAKGFKGLWVTGETACFFERGDVKELVSYEKSLHKKVDLPMQVVCAYDTSQVPIGVFYDLIAAHGNTLLLGPEIQVVT